MVQRGLLCASGHDRSGDVATALGHLLLHLGRYEQVRTIEAIAATIANAVDRSCSQAPVDSSPSTGAARARRECFAQHLVALEALFGTADDAAEDDVVYASCLRIARRAIAAAISDPTGGATRFHSIDEAPQWTRGVLPCASMGGFLFYRDDTSLQGVETGPGR